MRNLYRLLPVFMLALAVSSCQTQPQSDAAEATTGTIGVTLLTMTHPFFQNLAAGLEEAAAENNMTVTVNSAEFDVARQRNQIADFIVQGVDKSCRSTYFVRPRLTRHESGSILDSSAIR